MFSKLKNKNKIFIMILLLSGALVVNANKKNKYSYLLPKGFIEEENLLPNFFPTRFTHTGPYSISLMIPPEYKVKHGAPKTIDGKLHNDFIKGKLDFNRQFGIQDWKMRSYKFSELNSFTKLEINGSYKSSKGVINQFIEHHYFSKNNRLQSIHMIYPNNTEPTIVTNAIASLDSFKPNFQ